MHLRPLRKRSLMLAVSLAAILAVLWTGAAAQQSSGAPAVRLVAQDTVLPYIYAGLNWYRQDRALELSGVPTDHLYAKVLAIAYTDNADAFLAPYTAFVDFMRIGLFQPLNAILPGHFQPPRFDQADLLLYQGEVIGVCFGGYDMRFLDRPCIGVFRTSPRQEEAARFITVLKENEPVTKTVEGELKRVTESFFATLFYVGDYVSAFHYLYSDPARRQGEWRLEEWVETMTHQWLYRRVNTLEVNVDINGIRFIEDWVSPRDGLVYPQVAELEAEAVLSQDPNYVWFGRYPVRYRLHWAPVGDEWKVLSAPYHLFE